MSTASTILFFFQDHPVTHMMPSTGESWHLITMHYHDSCHASSSWNILLPPQSRWKKQGHHFSNISCENTLYSLQKTYCMIPCLRPTCLQRRTQSHRNKSVPCYKCLPTLYLAQHKAERCLPSWKPAELHPHQMPLRHSVGMKLFAVVVCRCRAERTFWWGPTVNNTIAWETFEVLENSSTSNVQA